MEAVDWRGAVAFSLNIQRTLEAIFVSQSEYRKHADNPTSWQSTPSQICEESRNPCDLAQQLQAITIIFETWIAISKFYH